MHLTRRHRCPAIDPALARLLAGQVAAGLAHGEGASPRAALTAIGTMLAQAVPDDAIVAETLDAAGRLHVAQPEEGTHVLTLR